MSEPNALLVRYNEIGLKGGNRPAFERRLESNLRAALGDQPDLKVARIRGRTLVRAGVPADRLEEAASRVFGVASLSAAFEVAPQPEQIFATAQEVAGDVLAKRFAGRGEVAFRVSTNRAEKSFPFPSMDMDRRCGALLTEAFPQLVVNLRQPELHIEIDIRSEGTWLFADRRQGPGGLPVGSLGKGVCLLSGGIDSPVAAWLAMKRGVRVEFVSFYSFPHVGPQTREKIIRLTEKLTDWQPYSVLHVVPFAGIQEAIRDAAPEGYRTVLYRRSMQRIASRLARRRKAQALVTGDSVGQVASQTLENLTVIQAAASLPVLQPLITYDKVETIRLARRIGTLELSHLPAPDCCTVFQPLSPVIYGRLDEALAAEAGLELEALEGEAISGTERLRFPEET